MQSAMIKACVAFAAVAAICGLSAPADAEKVGVAAAVNPDAFSSLAGSPQTQLSIGKSIFYNERINTTGSGLVQVLLVDGSTFTVGPGSDLVIDRFVYDPKKGTGQIAASFSKGVARFVGGKISKNQDGVVVNTPAGALAIRGGMAQWKLNGSKGIFSFLYGKEMSLAGHNVYEPGYTIDTTTGVPTIRPTTSADINAIMASLTNGSTGGLGTSNTDNDGNPDQALQEANNANETAADIINQANQTQVQGEIQNQLNNQQTPTPPETVPLPTELTMRVLTPPDYYIANKRSFWSPGVFIVDPGAHGILGGDDVKIPCFFSPQVCGGSYYGFFEVNTDDYEMTWTSVAGGRATGTVPSLIARTGFLTYANTEEGPFDFPIFNVVGVHEVTNATMIDPEGNIVTLKGSAFTGKGGGFFAYQLFQVDDLVTNFNKPLLAFGGETFTPPVGQGDQIRLFNVFTDPRQNISIPFAAKETAPANLAGASIQPLYLLEDTSDGGRSVWLQTSFRISGQGTDQETILVLALGEQNQETGQLTGLRRGMSYIQTALIDFGEETDPVPFKQPINLSGSIATLAGPQDGEVTPYLFGTSIPHFVIGADSTGNGHKIFEDQPLYPEAFDEFSVSAFDGPALNYGLHDGPYNPPSSEFLGATYHIGEQVAQANASTVTPVTTDQDVDFYGYAAGIYQQTTDGLDLEGGELPVGILANTTPDQVHLKFKDDHRLSAWFDLQGAGDNEDGGARLAFGDWDGAHGRSAVINGDIYAAVESATQKSTVTVDTGYGPYTYHTQRTADASLYLVSGALLGTTGSGLLCASCDFLKWGTWGGQLQFKDGEWVPVTADINLGWYVAGNVVQDTVGALPTTGSATYNGIAIGTVANNLSGNGWNTYVASGDMTMGWNFASRTGTLDIMGFDKSVTPDGLSFSGAMSMPGVVGPGQINPTNLPNRFSGDFGGTNAAVGTLTGSANGSFVASPGPGQTPTGVMGNWNVHNDNYGAAGIFGGRRQ